MHSQLIYYLAGTRRGYIDIMLTYLYIALCSQLGMLKIFPAPAINCNISLYRYSGISRCQMGEFLLSKYHRQDAIVLSNPQGAEGYCSCLVRIFFLLELLGTLFIC